MNEEKRAGEISPVLPRWVKASERMPPVGECCGKCEGRPAVIKNEMEGGNYLLANGNYVSPRFVEWLEEIN